MSVYERIFIKNATLLKREFDINSNKINHYGFEIHSFKTKE